MEVFQLIFLKPQMNTIDAYSPNSKYIKVLALSNIAEAEMLMLIEVGFYPELNYASMTQMSHLKLCLMA